MPWTDWQFLIVTGAALWAAWVLVRQMVPRRDAGASPCSDCASGSAACSRPRPADDSATRRPTSSLVVLDERR
ncbi:MAG: hypothetical protein AAGC60_12835 [Acidobacteriota bacterium]